MATKNQTIIFVLAWLLMMLLCLLYLTNRFTTTLLTGKNSPLLFLMLLATLSMIRVVLRYGRSKQTGKASSTPDADQ